MVFGGAGFSEFLRRPLGLTLATGSSPRFTLTDTRQPLISSLRGSTPDTSRVSPVGFCLLGLASSGFSLVVDYHVSIIECPLPRPNVMGRGWGVSPVPDETAIPARIHVLLARNASTGVVIRRGPSKRVCTIGWHRRTDEFKVGQWLKGRIYERRSDLSPDGKYLIYFAMNGAWKSETQGSWTAISRAPYLKAVGLWAKGDCWHGGGLFTADDSYWINSGPYPYREIRTPDWLCRVGDYPGQGDYGSECRGVYYLRLQRDGWTLVAQCRVAKRDTIDVFEKPIDATWTLRKLARVNADDRAGNGGYFDEHELVNRNTGAATDCRSWEWADLDGTRLVWSDVGKLYAGRVTEDGLGQTTLLCDFNPMEFEPLTAPYDVDGYMRE